MTHYIEADRLRAEIDKRYAEYRAKMKTDDFTYYEGMADALDLFEQFLDTLLEQPVKGLEEAAENIYKTPFGTRAEDFIAGAEWMAGQGWISVDERLPEMDEEVIVLKDKQNTGLVYEISFGHLVDTERCIDYNGWNVPDVKYWMPCPKIPNND